MLNQLALLLPLLAQAQALGGSHYVDHRAKTAQKIARAANPDPEPLGGSHYVAHRNSHKVGKVRDNQAQKKRYLPFWSPVYVPVDERGIPITATTTVIVPATTTETVWVDPTPTGSDSPAPSASGNDTIPAPSPAPSGNETAPIDPSASASVLPSDSASSDIPSATSNSTDTPPLPTGSAGESGSSSAIEPSSTPPPSSSAPISAEPSASGSISPSNSITASPSPESSIVPSVSGSLPPSSDVVPSPSVSGEVTPSPSASGEVTPSPSISGEVTPSPSISGEVTPSPSISSEVLPSSSISVEVSSSPSASEVLPTESSSYFSSTAAPTSSEIPLPSASSTSSWIPEPTGSIGNTVMGGYYADWSANRLPPESIDWSRFDVIDFAFAEPAQDGTLMFTQTNSGDLLHRVVAGAHAHGKRVKLSVGGWTGSAYFSSLVANPTTRANFINNLVDAVNRYQLDGLDIDWEYPGAAGAPGNQVSGEDSANLLLFLQELRAALPQGALITAATQVWPFYGPNGQPLADVSPYAKLLDWILLMNYDIWGSSSTPGPNAPLSDGCKDSDQPTANAYAAVAAWTSAGFPANQITLGVPAYGYIQMSSANQLYGRGMYPRRGRMSRRAVTVQNDAGGTTNGQVGYSSLVQQGAIDPAGNGLNGFTRNWDDCSSTPWLKSLASGQIITFDDPQSMNLKGQFAAQAGLKGCSVFSMDGDWVNGAWPLTDAVRSGMGI